MKFDKILAISLATTMSVAFTACDDVSDDYVAASLEQGAKAYFLPSNAKQIDLLDSASSFDVKLSRSESSSALSVPVNFTASKEGVFTCPATVDFAAGSSEATLTVAYDGTKLDFEEPVDFSITIDAAASSIYGIASYSATAMIPAPWASIGVGTIVDDYITGFFGVENVAWQVEIEAHQLIPGFYRLVNPYGAGYPYNEPGDYDTTQDYYLEIHAEDPSKVWIPTTTYGMDWGYGNFIFGSMAGLRIGQGKPEAAEGYYGQLADGIITFPANSLLIGMSDYDDGGLYTCNESGAFKVVMPGIVLADYSVELSYAGKYYDASDNLYAVAEVTALGEDVEEVRLAVAPAAEANDLVAAIVSGECEDYVALSAPGQAMLPMGADAESGKYSIVAVTYAGGEAQEANSVNFKYTSMSGEPEETWTPLFFGDYEYSLVFGTPEEPEYDLDLVLYQSDNDPSRYKIAHWLMDVDFIFTMDNEGNCTVLEDQETGYVNGGDMILFEELGLYAETDQMGWSFYENGVFYFNIIYYVEDGYYGYGYETFTLTAEYSEESAARGQHKAVAATEKHAVKSAKHKKTSSALRCLKKNAIRLN